MARPESVIAERLAAAGVPTPETDAVWLLRHVTGWTAAELARRGAEPLDEAQAARLEELVARRERREPLQLVLGTVAFRYLEYEVRPGVFVPRPETEVLAGEAIARTPTGGVVVEPCTGTGVVACAIASEASPGRVVATDASPGAVELARSNAAKLELPVEVVEGDLLQPVTAELRGQVDVLVSNPPYLAERDFPQLEPEVADWDPYLALVAGPTGHEASDRLIREAPGWLRPGGWLLLEVDESRARAATRRCRAAGLADATIMTDLAGRDRIVLARHP
jgi:release factor glutamine methyltransferase